ncbi:iron ABC transporter permease [Thalassotalea ponticola]|uniref:ABC transporter permease n=1 Tax=Thalassotalea ponticola TaxID=1523392 RepID=UPI0025B2D897|nr:iron ABC transporter permease [Thalassotalea ponticola]MDN3652013.1 iron ABC transporter permease [Thalassotalea ponticola]
MLAPKWYSPWSIASYATAAILVLPLFALIAQSMLPDTEVFSHLLDTVLADYVVNTLALIALVICFSLLIGVPLAYLLANYHFTGSRFFQWGLLLPLAMPSYVMAYIYTDWLEYAGPVQRFLRATFDWQSKQDYWFFEIRSLFGAALVLSLVLFPYVYLIVKTAFKEQSHTLSQAATMLGKSASQVFWQVSLPLARPAIAIAASLVAMETLADFAAVSYFAVNTLTTAVYDTWLSYGSLTAASKISVLMLIMVFALMSLERFSRNKQRSYQSRQQQTAKRLTGYHNVLATSFCLLVLALAFMLPVVYLADMAWTYHQQAFNRDFIAFGLNSLTLAAIVASLCVLLALIVVIAKRFNTRIGGVLPMRFASSGYAMPGTVLAIAVLIPLTLLDHGINDYLLSLELSPIGLVFTGTITAMIFAYTIRFIAVAIGALESSYERMPPNLDQASFMLGSNRLSTVLRVHLPLLKRGALTASLLVFIESMKELPAALLLRPFNYDTLATYVFQYVSDEQLELASLAAISIVIAGLLPIILLNRSMEQYQH